MLRVLLHHRAEGTTEYCRYGVSEGLVLWTSGQSLTPSRSVEMVKEILNAGLQCYFSIVKKVLKLY